MMHRRCETREVIGKTIKRSPRLVRYVKGEGKGYTCALNRGLAESHGEWLALFDDDELADPDWLKELYTFAVHIGAQCVGGVPRTRVPGDLVFYEGANIENRTKIFLKLGVDVVAIELQDKYVNILESSFDKNKHLQSLKRFLGFGRRS